MTRLPTPAFLSAKAPLVDSATVSPRTTPLNEPAVSAAAVPSYVLPAAVMAPVKAFGVMLACVVALVLSR
ncbi:hypothetical protein D3C87_1967030 [compost metagenome]